MVLKSVEQKQTAQKLLVQAQEDLRMSRSVDVTPKQSDALLAAATAGIREMYKIKNK